MSEPYLIAHKVRGEPAFDIAIKMEVKIGFPVVDRTEEWWIIPTSGHRAFPYFEIALSTMDFWLDAIPSMPPDLPDHYAITSEPRRKADTVRARPPARSPTLEELA